jgi:hypothetical protein
MDAESIVLSGIAALVALAVGIMTTQFRFREPWSRELRGQSSPGPGGLPGSPL